METISATGPGMDRELPRRIWRGSDLLLGLVALLAGFAAIIAFASIAGDLGLVDPDDTGDPFFALITIAFEAFFMAAVLALAWRRGLSFGDLGFRAPTRWGLLPAAVVGAYLALLLYGVGLDVIEQYGVDVSGLREGNPLPAESDDPAYLWVLYGFAAVVVAPFAEEVFFRAFIFRAVAGFSPVILAYAISGFAFGAFHVNPSVLIPFTLIGIVFAWAYWMSRSIWTTIGAHLVFNGIAFIVSLQGFTP